MKRALVVLALLLGGGFLSASSAMAVPSTATTTTVINNGELKVTVDVPVNTCVGAGAKVIYHVTNTSGMKQTGLKMSFLSARADVGSSQVVNIGTLGVGETRSGEVVVKSTTTNPLVGVMITGDSLTVCACECFTLPSHVCRPRLTLLKLGPPIVVRGHDVVYALFVKNVGDGVARNVILRDILPRNFVFPGKKIKPRLRTIPVGDLQPGQQKRILVTARAVRLGCGFNRAWTWAIGLKPVPAQRKTCVNAPKPPSPPKVTGSHNPI